jgi:hypothetical protein
VLDQAAAGGEVGDVELVDLGRDGDKGALVAAPGGGRVLDELEHLAAVNDLARRDGQVDAHLEGAGVHRGRHAAVVAEVVEGVTGSGEQAAAPGLGGFGQGVWVAEECVRRCHGFGEQHDRETGPLTTLVIQAQAVDKLQQCVAIDQVRLQEPVVERIVSPGVVGEALVARRRRNRAFSQDHLCHLSGRPGTGGRHLRWLQHGALAQPGPGGGDLAAVDTDKRIGAQNRRIVPVEAVCLNYW